MQKLPEIILRDIPSNDIIDDLIREKVADLESTNDHLMSCRVTVEKLSKRHHKGNPYGIFIDLKIAPRHEIIIKEESKAGDMELTTLIRDAFKKARVALSELKKRERNHRSHKDNEEEL